MSRNNVTLQIIDTGYVDVAKEIEVKLQAGVLSEDAKHLHSSGLRLGELAAIHEFGAGRSPMRAPLRRWGARYEKTFKRKIRAALKEAVRTQKWTSKPIQDLAEHATRSLRSDFYRGKISPANSQATLKRKAPEKRPLMETGELSSAQRVKAQVFRRGFKKGGTRRYQYISTHGPAPKAKGSFI